MAYDEVRKRTVLFGGCTEASPCASAQTWTFNGQWWRQMMPATSPPARHGATLVYDPARQVTVLFGGYAANGTRLGDTWTWDGSTWQQRTPSTSPPPRAEAVAAWSRQAGRVLLFGGEGNTGKLADTWAWDGTAWTAGATGPAARSMSALADTGTAQGLLLYGGRGTAGQLADTWTFNGTGWTLRSPAASPGTLERHAAAFDPRTNNLLLTGGWSDASNDYDSSIWSWDGSDWLLGTAALVINYPGASGVAGAGLALSPKDGLVQFGGRIGQNSTSRLDWSTYVMTYLPIGRPPSSSIDDQQLTDRMSAGVNLANAGLVLSATDLRLPGINGMDLAFTRHFSSLAGSYLSTSMPSRWRYELLDTAAYATPGGSVVITPLDGQQMLFVKNATGWTAPADSDMVLTSPAAGVFELRQRQAQRTWTFTTGGKLTKITDRNGNTIRIARDPGTLKATNITDTQDRVVTLAYEPTWGYLSAITDPTGRKTTLTYSSTTANLAQTNTVAPDGTVLDSTTYTTNYGDFDITHPAGNKTGVRLGNFNRAARIVRITDKVAGTGPTRTYNHDYHPTVQVTDPLGRHTSYRASEIGNSTLTRIERTTDPLGRVRSDAFDVRGNQIGATNGLGATWTAGYDSLDNRTSVRAPDVAGRGTGSGRVTSWAYANTAQPHQPSSSTDTQGNVSSHSYDAAGNRTKIQDTTGGTTSGQAVSATYNPPAGGTMTCGGRPGQVCSETDGRNLTTNYVYNGAGNRARTTPPAPAKPTSFDYDTAGRVVSRTDGKGQITRHVYDSADRLTQVRLSGVTACTSTEIAAGNCVKYDYDRNGNLLAQHDRNGQLSYGYDALNRVTSRTNPGQSAITSSYDANSNLLSLSDPAGTTNYSYDAANQLVTLAEPGGSCTSSPTVRCTRFGYDNDGNRTTTTYPTNPTTTMTVTPDNTGRPQRIKTVTGSGSTAVTHTDLSYIYDYTTSSGSKQDGALVSSRTDHLTTSSSGSGYVTGYGYDTQNQLKHVTETDWYGTVVNRWLYSYDRSGNRTSASLTGTPGAATTSFGYDNANRLISRDGSTAGFSYDDNGNETAAVGASTRTAGTWNNKDQLTAATVGATTTTFSYLGRDHGERLSAGATSFRNADQGVLASTTGSTTTSFVRDPAGRLVAMRRGTTSYYYLFDNIGSVLGLVDANGARSHRYTYDPYGIHVTAPTEPAGVSNPYRFTGEHRDSQTGLYKLGIRYYDPTLGRFTQVDPTGQDPHYTYARNNPSNFTDPTGAAVECEDIALVGGILGGAAIGVGVTAATFGVGTLAFAVGASAVGGVGGGTLVAGIGTAICGF